MAIQVDHSTRGDVLVLTLEGTIAVIDVPDLERAFLQTPASDARLAVLDFTGVSFISSLGLGTLVSYRRGLVRKGCEVAIAGMNPLIRDVFKRAQLEDVFDIYESVEDAVASVDAS